MSIKLISAINSAPRDRDSETVKLTLNDGNYYLGYVKEKNNMLGEPTVYFYVIEDPGGHSGNNLWLKECDIATIVPWNGHGQPMVWV